MYVSVFVFILVLARIQLGNNFWLQDKYVKMEHAFDAVCVWVEI